MRVLITGGTGDIGKAATERLVKNGWDVRVLDLAEHAEIAGTEYVQGNILNYDDMVKHTRGCDMIIHLAALRMPSLGPGHEVFQVNVAGTFNVFEAAAANGIKRIVQASSINALGCYYNIVEIHPEYFPIDEDHPTSTFDPYSFSKGVVEDIGDYYWRREGISSLAYRFPGVYLNEYFESEGFFKKREAVCQMMDDLLSKPEPERRAIIGAVNKRILEFRSQRPLEYYPERGPVDQHEYYADPLFRSYMGDRYTYWAYIDARDAAQALEKGLTAKYEGAHVLFINSSCNVYGYDSQKLVDLFFPEVTQFKSDLSGSPSLVSMERARKLIGFEPEYLIPNRR